MEAGKGQNSRPGVFEVEVHLLHGLSCYSVEFS